MNINEDAAAWLVVWWTPISLVSMHFLGGVELTEICSKCVCRTQPELHTFLPLQHTSTMAAIVYAIEYQWRCCCLAGHMVNVSKLVINVLSGWCGSHWNLFQVCTSYTARAAHSPLYIWWCHQNRCNWISTEMLLPGWSYDERLQALY